MTCLRSALSEHFTENNTRPLRLGKRAPSRPSSESDYSLPLLTVVMPQNSSLRTVLWEKLSFISGHKTSVDSEHFNYKPRSLMYEKIHKSSLVGPYILQTSEFKRFLHNHANSLTFSGTYSQLHTWQMRKTSLDWLYEAIRKASA